MSGADIEAVRVWLDDKHLGSGRRLILLVDPGRKWVTAYDFTTLRHRRLRLTVLARARPAELDRRSWRRIARTVTTKLKQFDRYEELRHYRPALAKRIAAACRARAKERS